MTWELVIDPLGASLELCENEVVVWSSDADEEFPQAFDDLTDDDAIQDVLLYLEEIGALDENTDVVVVQQHADGTEVGTLYPAEG